MGSQAQAVTRDSIVPFLAQNSNRKMDAAVAATFDAGNDFNTKLRDTLSGLLSANNERKSEIDALRSDHDQLKSDHDALEVTTTRENDLRKNEIKSLEERTQKDNQARITDIAKLDGKLDSEDKALSDRISKEISDREAAISDLQNRSDSQNDERISDIADLKTKMMQENAFLKSLSGKTLGVYFNAYRTKAYDGGGEENLTFQGTYCNVGGGLDTDTGIFTCPTGGTYMFQFHIATHDNKKALLSIRKNGEEIASIFDQNHKDNHKNSMAGQNIIMDVKRGDEIVVYAYT